jgi:hypothetical protein
MGRTDADCTDQDLINFISTLHYSATQTDEFGTVVLLQATYGPTTLHCVSTVQRPDRAIEVRMKAEQKYPEPNRTVF